MSDTPIKLPVRVQPATVYTSGYAEYEIVDADGRSIIDNVEYYPRPVSLEHQHQIAASLNAAPVLRDVLRSYLSDTSDGIGLVSASYCSVCCGEAPKNVDGTLCGPVVHKDDCSYERARRALEMP